MWRARGADAQQIQLLRVAREKHDLYPLVIHVNYLVNLASLDPVIRAKSIDCFRGELERAAAIGAEYLVLHPGSWRGHAVEEGIAAFVLGLRDAAVGLRLPGLTVLIENTVGAGCHLGSRFEELHSIRDSSISPICRSAIVSTPATFSRRGSTLPQRGTTRRCAASRRSSAYPRSMFSTPTIRRQRSAPDRPSRSTARATSAHGFQRILSILLRHKPSLETPSRTLATIKEPRHSETGRVRRTTAPAFVKRNERRRRFIARHAAQACEANRTINMPRLVPICFVLMNNPSDAR
jgi:hypothetical protein